MWGIDRAGSLKPVVRAQGAGGEGGVAADVPAQGAGGEEGVAAAAADDHMDME
jgi:hypothetical protein